MTVETKAPGDNISDYTASQVENDEDKKRIIEALIFASDEPITLKQIKLILEGDQTVEAQREEQTIVSDEKVIENATISPSPEEAPRPGRKRKRAQKSGLTPQTLKRYVAELNSEYADTDRSFGIVELAGGYTFQTLKEYGIYVGKMFAERVKRRLTQAALETLSIIAFRQPISKPEIESIRGVGADFVLKSLLEKELITIVGRDESVGRPLLYGTTQTFLRHFGLGSLKDLPKPRDIEELLEEENTLGIQTIEETDEDKEEERKLEDLISTSDEIFSTIPRRTEPDIDEGDTESFPAQMNDSGENIRSPLSFPITLETESDREAAGDDSIITDEEHKPQTDDFELDDR